MFATTCHQASVLGACRFCPVGRLDPQTGKTFQEGRQKIDKQHKKTPKINGTATPDNTNNSQENANTDNDTGNTNANRNATYTPPKTKNGFGRTGLKNQNIKKKRNK